MPEGDKGENSATITYTGAGLIMVTNLGVVIAFDIAYLINPELFPTILLASAYGICNIFGRAVSIFAPIVAKIPNPYPLIILIGYSLLCVFLSTKLTRT